MKRAIKLKRKYLRRLEKRGFHRVMMGRLIHGMHLTETPIISAIMRSVG